MLVLLNNCCFILLLILISKQIIKLRVNINYTKLGLVSGIIVLFTIASQQTKNGNYLIVMLFVTIIIALRIVCEENIGILCMYAIPMYISTSVLVQMMRVMISSLEGIYNIGAKDQSYEFMSLLFLIVMVILGTKIVKINYGLRDVPIGYHILLNVIIILNSVGITFIGGFISNALNADHKWIIELSYAFTVLGVFVQLGLLIAMILSRDEHKEKEALNAKYLEEQVSHYEYLEEREQETRKFRHDMRNHLMILRNLYDTGKTKEFEKYFDTITDRITNFGNQISVGNNTADAIINQYAKEAELAGITLQVEGRFPTDCHIDAVDICTIFANLLSNAIRAEKESDGHQVNLIVRNMDNELFIQVQNDYVTQIKRSGERFVSTKEDRGNHGLGLQNVYDCVERNHGIIHITTDNQIFDVKLSLKNTEA